MEDIITWGRMAYSVCIIIIVIQIERLFENNQLWPCLLLKKGLFSEGYGIIVNNMYTVQPCITFSLALAVIGRVLQAGQIRLHFQNSGAVRTMHMKCTQKPCLLNKHTTVLILFSSRGNSLIDLRLHHKQQPTQRVVWNLISVT